jgi:hypothetical protein
MADILSMVLITLIVISYFLITYVYVFYPNSNSSAAAPKISVKITTTQESHQCDSHSCKNMDPVSDPKYNMQQIVKQSILLEEHLANKNKRCRDCITKHFLHIIGLAEEAQMLATNKIEKYPLIIECVELYNSLFKKWLKDGHYEEKNILCCCDELRTMRKRLIAVYFFDST